MQLKNLQESNPYYNDMKTEENFADYETSKMAKELGFDELCLGSYYTEKDKGSKGGEFNIIELIPTNKYGTAFEPAYIINKDKEKYYVSAPLWQQLEEWLWEEYKIWIHGGANTSGNKFNSVLWDKSNPDRMPVISSTEYNDSPITAKTEGIKAAIKHLHKQLKTK